MMRVCRWGSDDGESPGLWVVKLRWGSPGGAQMMRDLQGMLRWWESPGETQMMRVSRWDSDDGSLQVGSDDEGVQVGVR